MAVRIAAGSGARLRRSPTGFVVLVDVETSQREAAARALEAARDRLLRLDVPDPELGLDPRTDANAVAYVSPVSPHPRGAFFYVDGGQVPPRDLGAVLDWAAEEVQRQDIGDAIISVPAGASPLEPMWRRHPGPSLTLAWQAESLFRPEPAPESWSGIAQGWLTGDTTLLRAGLHALVPGMDVPVEADAVPSALGLPGAARVDLRQVLAGGPATGFRFAHHVNAGECRLLTLGATGPAGEALGELAAELTATAEADAGACTYAFLEIGWPDPLRDRLPLGDHPGRMNCLRLLDEVVFDAFPFQVLGPGHLRALPEQPDGLHALAEGRAALRLGEPPDWADQRRADAVRARGRHLLAPLIPSDRDFLERSARRTQQQFADRDPQRDGGSAS